MILFLLLSGVKSFAEEDGGAPAWQQCSPYKDKVLYIIGYAHLDTQWRWTYQDSINSFIPNTMHFNFALLDKYPNYKFNFTGARRYQMMKEYYPGDYEKVKDYIAKGRWHISGSSVDENDANVPAPESIIRHVLYGNHFFRKEFSKTSEDYMLPDCFGFTASLPSALAHAGLKGFSTQKLTWGSPVGIPFNVGIWEGPDGRYIPAALNPGSYGNSIREDLSKENSWLQRIEETGKKSGFYADFKYYGTGDVGGSPDEESVVWLEKSIQGGGPLCVVPGASDQIFRELKPESIEKLPRYKGDLLLKEHSAGSLTSQSYMKRWNRKNELLIDAAERASVIADWLAVATYPIEKLTRNWFLILGNQMHDILPGTAVPKAYEFSWNDEVIALNNSAFVLTDGVGAVTRLLDTRVKGVPVIVFNPLSVEREDVVKAKLRFSGDTPSNLRVYNPQGTEVPSQIVGKSGEILEIEFMAKVPSIGFAVYDVQESNAPCTLPTGLKVTDNTLENAQYRVRIDDNGDVASVFDKVTGRELLSGTARLILLEDSPNDWPAWNTDWEDWNAAPRSIVQGPAKVRIVEKGPVRIALEVTRMHEGSTYIQTISLAAGSAGDRLEFNLNLDWRTPESCLKASFPLAASNPLASYNLGMGVIERPNNNSGKYEVPSRQWFDLTDTSRSFGTAVLEDSKFGSDKPDDNTLRLTLVRTPKCNGFFDQATQDLGQHKILYALAGHSGDWRESGIAWRGARLNQPPVAFTAPVHKGSLGKSFSFLKTSTSQVAVLALKKAEDGDEIVVRLQELYGKSAKDVVVSFAVPIASAREVDGQERTIGDATIRNGALVVDMGGFSPRSFSIKLKVAEQTAGLPKSIPFSIDFDTVAASSDGEKSLADFDGKGNSYPAEMLPKTLVVDDITFNLGLAGTSQKNSLSCKGQSISIPGGKHNRLYFLASSSGGDLKGIFKIDGVPTSLTTQEWTGYVGQWDNRIWKNEREIYGLQPAFTRRDNIAWYASHRHNKNGENESYNYTYLFKYRLDLPANAKVVTLPNNPEIRIFAMTAAANENDDAEPAQMLYDNFEKPAEPPLISPISGNFKDSILMSIQKPWYAGFDDVRFTTDGSEPTMKSEPYTVPVWIRKDTTVRTRAFGANGTVSLESKEVFHVNDTTPPGVLSVSAFDGDPMLVVEFTEPVDKASTERVSSYHVEPDLGVVSSALSVDGKSVKIKISKSPVVGEKYTITIDNLADVSQAANKITSPVKLQFSIAPPVLNLKFLSSDSIINLGSIHDLRDFHINGKPSIVNGKFGAALKLSGERQCLDVKNKPELNPTTAMTVSAWFNADNWDGNRRIIQKGNDDNQYRLFNDGGKLSFSLAGIGSVTCPLPSMRQWHHVAATYDGTVMRLYIDGKQVGETAASGTIFATSDSLFIGTKHSDAPDGDYFKGLLDKIIIWNYAVSADRIRALSEETKK